MIYTKDKLERLSHRWKTPRGKKLLAQIKRSKCYLSPVLFREHVHNFPGINDDEVKDKVDLRGAPLSGFDFRVPIQEDEDDFVEDIAILSDIHFEGASLKHCQFQDGKIHDCNFEQADLSHASFKNCYVNNCNFQESTCLNADFSNAKLINSSFVDTNIRDILTSLTIVDAKTNFGKTLKSEKDNLLHFASIEYKKIKQIYKNSNLHGMADEFHYKEMVTKRKTSHKKGINRAANYIFGDLLCRYGTSFMRVLISSFVIITLYALEFMGHQALLFNNSVVTSPSFLKAFYFSMITFTTVGYGDYSPTEAYALLAASESFIGAALMALFTVIVARILVRE